MVAAPSAELTLESIRQLLAGTGPNGTGAAGSSPLQVQGGGATTVPGVSFTRPSNTTQYSVGDIVANSTVAGSIVPMQFSVGRIAGGSGLLRRIRARKTGTSITSASFRLHLYRSLPTPSNGDNGVWLTNNADGYMGSFDVTFDKAFTDGAAGNGLPTVGSELNYDLPDGQWVVYGLVEARATYTPVSAEQFSFYLEDLQN